MRAISWVLAVQSQPAPSTGSGCHALLSYWPLQVMRSHQNLRSVASSRGYPAAANERLLPIVMGIQQALPRTCRLTRSKECQGTTCAYHTVV